MSARKPVFFLPEAREPKASLYELLAPHGEIREGGPRKWTEEELVRGAAEWDAILVTSRERISAPVIEAGGRLKIIAKIGVGVENIDIPAATRRRIPVTNCPGANAVAVAEATIGLMLAACRKIPQAMFHLQGGAWRNGLKLSGELTGATFGIVGFGNIGREVARLLRGFEGRILAYDAYVPAGRIRAGGAEPADLDTLVREADFVSLHCSLTPETHHLFDAGRFGQMKPTAVIVNCARGPIIDEAALVAALEGGAIGAAGIDVFETEPPAKDNPLFRLPNAVVTPHIAGGTVNARERINASAAANVIRALRGERVDPATLLNPEIYNT